MSLLQWSSLFALVSVVAAQGAAWSQCGGENWTGATTCVSGYTCVYSNPYYSQCLPASTTGTATTTGSGSSSSASASSTTSLPGSTSTAYSNTVAKAAGKKYFGSATDNPELTNSAYVAILNNTGYFGQITPGNSMKWDATEPEQGVFDFSGGNQIVDLAEGNGQILRGHNCVWYNQLPSWVTSGNFNATELASIVVNHCSTIVGYWAGKMYSWDVINEPLNDDGTYRSDVFYNTLGVSYIALALNAARAADPKAKLYINDYNIEYEGAKATAMLNLVKQLQANGTAIDGIGMQGHFIVGEVPTTIAANMKQFTALGLEVAITELDIRMTLPETAALLEQQKTDYNTVISACNSVSGCVGVTIWDYTDLYSWVPSTFSGQGAACPWDSNLVKKPAYDGIIAGFTS